MDLTKNNLDEIQRRRLQEYIFDLEEMQERAENLSVEYEQLKRTQDLLNAIVNATTHGLCLIKKHTIVWCNKGITDIFGWEIDALTGKTIEILSADLKAYAEMNAHISRSSPESGVINFEYDFIHKNGSVIPCLLSHCPLDNSDLSKGYIFSFTDISKRKRAEKALKKAYENLEEQVNERTKELYTANEQLNLELKDRKLAEAALRESQERYSAVVKQASEGIYLLDPYTKKILEANNSFCKMTGYTSEEVSDANIYDFLAHNKEEIDANIKEVISKTYYFVGERKYCHKNGGLLYFEARANLISFGGRDVLCVVVRDITGKKRIENEKLRLEKQLQQAQKMEAIGTLAGGIAHDFNNLLMGIQGRTSLMLMDADPSHFYFEHLKGIEDYVKSAADLTRQLLGFARGGKYDVKPTDLNELIKNQNQMFGRTRKEINIRAKYEKTLWTTEIDQGQIEQVLLNLYVNAWQAMPGGGDLYIQTENIIIDKDYSKPYQVDPGKYVKISITDTGVGMDRATQQRIFEPFFTTKDMGRGTGLGLASSYGIIKNHGGFIEVYSEKGEGTAFNIYLPGSEKEAPKAKKPQEEILKGAETVLLVDDEKMILDVGREIIEKLGYNVLIAEGGKEALEICKNHPEKIDLVVLDMIMPHMDGGKAYDQLKEINPDIKVLLSSGYSLNSQASEILDKGCNGFIQKPFNIAKLSKKIRKVLNKP